MPRASSRRQILSAVQDQILPCLQHADAWRIFFADPSFHLPDSVAMQLNKGKPLLIKNAERSNAISSIMYLWPQAQVHSSVVPMMGFVLEGTTDWRIGITSAMARKQSKLKQSNYVVLALPKSTFYLAPSGVPYGTGLLSHWERSGGGKSLQMRFYPLGMQCHIGVGGGQKYTSHPPCIFPESRCYFAAQTLQEELRLRGTHSRQSIQGLLLFIMSRVANAMQKMQSPDWRPVGPEITEKNIATDAVEAACVYIENNFFQKITLSEIVEHALVSPTHLCHVFRQAKKVTLNEYITRFRMNYAVSLLQHSRISFGEIAKTVGYSNQSYFCQIFSRHFQCSPGEFRRNAIKQQDAQNN